ncbi:hypothetical protein K280104A7_07980 [Candidatus Bariatricus faecipullorum]|mgnify:FL=1
MKIFQPETRACMNALLRSAIFDSFLLIEGEITTFCQFHIDGRLHKEFFHQAGEEEAPDREFSLWQEQREYCFSLIRGKRTPLNFRFILALSRPDTVRLLEQENLSLTPEDVQGLYLNFHFNGTELSCTTGTSLNLFTLDKSLEQAWDKEAQQFFTKHGIPFEIPE